jgi:hypothetical protein
MLWNKRIAVFLILLLLVSTLAVVSHHHKDSADDHDCPICIASNHLSATSEWAVAFDSITSFTEITVVALSPVFIDNLFFYSLNNRAPPV